jgi:hypothetical protein
MGCLFFELFILNVFFLFLATLALVVWKMMIFVSLFRYVVTNYGRKIDPVFNQYDKRFLFLW